MINVYKIFNILNGDHLADQIKKASIEGEVIICREALVSGDLKASSLQDFWKLRAESVSKDYEVQEENYYEKVVPEFKKILHIPKNSEVNLWFEDDLFCQVNLWFCLSLLSEKKDVKIYRIFPKLSKEDLWKGFSDSESSDLKESLEVKILFQEKDIELGVDLWKAYQNNDIRSLKQRSENSSSCFRFLKEVLDVHLNRNPNIFIQNLIENGITDFNLVFEKFQSEFSILGFGDLQVKKIYREILNEKP